MSIVGLDAFGPTAFSSVQFSSVQFSLVWRCRDGVVWIVVVVHDDGAGHDSRPRRLEFDAGDCFCGGGGANLMNECRLLTENAKHMKKCARVGHAHGTAWAPQVKV